MPPSSINISNIQQNEKPFIILDIPVSLSLSKFSTQATTNDQALSNDSHCEVNCRSQNKIMISQFHVTSLERRVTHSWGENHFSIDPLKSSHDVTRAGYLVSSPGIAASGIQQLEEGARGGFKIVLEGGQPSLQTCWLCSPWPAGNFRADVFQLSISSL